MSNHCVYCNLDLDDHTLEELQKCEIKQKLSVETMLGGD